MSYSDNSVSATISCFLPRSFLFLKQIFLENYNSYDKGKILF